jgi:hypothetical protein
MSHEAAPIALKASPILGVATPTFLGVALPDWLIAATLIYTVLQTFVLVRDKLWKPWREKKEKSK